MRAVEVGPTFGLENLHEVERPSRDLGAEQVRVRVRAASLNYRDLMMITGQYNPRQPLPLVPCSDGAGEVIEVGSAVSRVKVGDRVAGLFFQTWLEGPPRRPKLSGALGGPLDGMLQEEIVLSQEGVSLFPEHLDFEAAACLPCAALTAWSALVTTGNVHPGETALILGTGGVSLFALQFAKCLGARVILLSSSAAKLERARVLGADELINSSTTPEWDRTVRKLTGGLGVDHVVEVGGAGTLERSLRSTTIGGTLSIIGVLAGATAPTTITPVLMGNLRLQGILVGSREGFEAMCRAIALHRVKPIVDRVFSLSESRAAFEHLKGASHFGKIVVRVS